MNLCHCLHCAVRLTQQHGPNTKFMLRLESVLEPRWGRTRAVYLKWSLTWTLGTPESLPGLTSKIFSYSTLILTLKKILLRSFRAAWNIYYCLGICCGFHWSWPQTLEYVLIYLGKEYRTPHEECRELSAEADGSWEWLILKKEKKKKSLNHQH